MHRVQSLPFGAGAHAQRSYTGSTICPMCKPEEVAKLIAFLASEDNTFVNGEGITIDGGQYA